MSGYQKPYEAQSLALLELPYTDLTAIIFSTLTAQLSRALGQKHIASVDRVHFKADIPSRVLKSVRNSDSRT